MAVELLKLQTVVNIVKYSTNIVFLHFLPRSAVTMFTISLNCKTTKLSFKRGHVHLGHVTSSGLSDNCDS